MEPVGQQPAEAELHLLTDWSDPDAKGRHRKAFIGSVLINVIALGSLLLLLAAKVKPVEIPLHAQQRVTPLILPPELTQPEPNHGKITKEFEVRADASPRKAITTPTSPAPSKRGDTPVPPSPPAPSAAPTPRPATPPSLPEPPKVDAAPAPEAAKPAVQMPPPPQIQTAEKPKLTFENPPANTGPVPIEQRRIALPGTGSITDLARDVVNGTPVGTIIGDSGAFGTASAGISQQQVPGNPLAGMQLRSDPEGVDFRPYLTQIMQTIKRNWMSVIPESVRMGRRGKVSLQFSIGKDGIIDKVVFAENSGYQPLDRAAVAGVTASNPLPPLPKDFKGSRIVLQLNFVYK